MRNDRASPFGLRLKSVQRVPCIGYKLLRFSCVEPEKLVEHRAGEWAVTQQMIRRNGVGHVADKSSSRCPGLRDRRRNRCAGLATLFAAKRDQLLCPSGHGIR